MGLGACVWVIDWGFAAAGLRGGGASHLSTSVSFNDVGSSEAAFAIYNTLFSFIVDIVIERFIVMVLWLEIDVVAGTIDVVNEKRGLVLRDPNIRGIFFIREQRFVVNFICGGLNLLFNRFR
jgi:hypothetical protein